MAKLNIELPKLKIGESGIGMPMVSDAPLSAISRLSA